MRVVAFSRARNEADIIEAFVRHNLAYADAMIMLDHGSTDATPQILRQLVEEGLPLHLVHDPALGHRQVVQANQLMHRAVEEFDADWVLCLDSDEFIDAPSVEAFHSVLRSARGAIRLTLRNYYVHPSDRPEEVNPVRRMTHYLVAAQPGDPVSEFKIMVPAAVVRTPGALLNQGNHEVLVEGHAVEAAIVPGIFLAHYSLRSAPQYAAKLAIAQFQRRRAISNAGDESSFLAPPYAVLRASYSNFAAQFPDFRVSYVEDQPGDKLVQGALVYRGGDLRYTHPREGIDAFVSEVLDIGELLASSGSPQATDHTTLTFAFEGIVLPQPGHKEVLHRSVLAGQWNTIELALDSPSPATAVRLRIAAAPGLLEIRRIEVVAEDDQALVWSERAALEAAVRIEEGGLTIWSPAGHRILTCKFPLVLHLDLGARPDDFLPKRMRIHCAFMPSMPHALVLRSEVLNRLNEAYEIARAKAAADALAAAQPEQPGTTPAPAPIPVKKAAPARYLAGNLIDFADQGTAPLYQVDGWSHAEPWGTWTDGPVARMRLILTGRPFGGLVLRARVRPFLAPGKTERRVTVAIDGQVCAEWRLVKAESQRVSARLPELLPTLAPVEIEFRIEDAESPSSLGLSIDNRRLGLGFETLSIGGVLGILSG
jgi:hypothetical protein